MISYTCNKCFVFWLCTWSNRIWCPRLCINCWL